MKRSCLSHSCLRTFATRVNARPRPPPSLKSAVSQSAHDQKESRKSRVPLYIGGVILYGASIYIGSSLYYIYYPPCPSPASVDEKHGEVQTSHADVYDEIAAEYDASINLDEVLMGLSWLRWYLLRNVTGDVLEVSAGTGRNLQYYKPNQVKSLTLVDQSGPMLDVARRKVHDMPTLAQKVACKDVALEGLSPNRESYDVVVQTFGLCSVSDPASFLTHLSKFCRADGEIILMEHGRSKYAWINRILDRTVDKHAEKWGCRYNRDVQEIVESCKNVEIVHCRRWHFGTTYIYHLRPKH